MGFTIRGQAAKLISGESRGRYAQREQRMVISLHFCLSAHEKRNFEGRRDESLICRQQRQRQRTTKRGVTKATVVSTGRRHGRVAVPNNPRPKSGTLA
jgi:hypothetical protein